ncbi:MAG: hypothetical protein AAGF11_43495 [Myxococcota bacterium]
MHDRSGTACLCIDKDAPYAIAEFPPELKDAFNDAALEECYRLAMTYYPEAVSTTCEEIYEAGNWKNNIVRPVASNANAKPPDFSCM